jgi:hypothetical protein
VEGGAVCWSEVVDVGEGWRTLNADFDKPYTVRAVIDIATAETNL